MKPLFLFLALALSGLLFNGAAQADNWNKLHKASKVTLQLKWNHQFQFAGYYMAKAKGFYREAGLDVEIKAADQQSDPIQEVLEGRAQFGIGTSELLLHHHRGKPVVVLGVIFQHSPLALLALEESGLDLITDLAGKKIMIERNSSEIYALLKQSNLDSSQIEVISHNQDIKDLLEKKVDAMTIYTTSEIYELSKHKIPYRLFTPRMAGIDFYGDNFFTTQQIVEERPEMVEAFRKATIKGWSYAVSNIGESIRHILTAYQIGSEEQLQFEASVMQSLMRTDLIEPGHMSENRWKHISSVYQELGLIPQEKPLNRFMYKHENIVSHLESRVNDLILLSLGIVLLALTIIWYLQRFYKVKNQLSTIMDQSPLAILLINQQYLVIEWNHQAEQIFGWQAEEVLGKNIFDFLVLKAHRVKVEQALEKVFHAQKAIHHENKNIHKSGKELTCNWSNAPFHVNGNKYIMCMALDTSELRDLKAMSLKKDDFASQHDATEIEQFLLNLVRIMNLSLDIWEECTSKSKTSFADQSGLWRVSLDGGTAKTRTLDKYLSINTIPQKPRWKNVINTANYIIRTFPSHPKIEELQTLKCSIHPPGSN